MLDSVSVSSESSSSSPESVFSAGDEGEEEGEDGDEDDEEEEEEREASSSQESATGCAGFLIFFFDLALSIMVVPELFSLDRRFGSEDIDSFSKGGRVGSDIAVI